jgi:hypothetical protein
VHLRDGGKVARKRDPEVPIDHLNILKNILRMNPYLFVYIIVYLSICSHSTGEDAKCQPASHVSNHIE